MLRLMMLFSLAGCASELAERSPAVDPTSAQAQEAPIVTAAQLPLRDPTLEVRSPGPEGGVQSEVPSPHHHGAAPDTTQKEKAPPAGHEHGKHAPPPADAHKKEPMPMHHEQEPATVYTCPMHPEVRSKTPGKCPKCGMTLVPAPKESGQ